MQDIETASHFFPPPLFLMMTFTVLCRRYSWEAIDKDNNVRYTLKLCESSPATSCGAGTAVCARDLATTTQYSVGQYRPLARQTSDPGLGPWRRHGPSCLADNEG